MRVTEGPIPAITILLVAGVAAFAPACGDEPPLDAATPCAANEAQCNDACVDLATSVRHCGACGVACEADEQCVGGACVLDCGALSMCGIECVDTRRDPEHCGGCLTRCEVNEVCQEGTCGTAWSARWSGGYGDEEFQDGFDVALDPAGNAFVVGGFEGSLDFGDGPLHATPSRLLRGDIFLAKLDPEGRAVWSKRFGDADDQLAFAVAADSQGAVIVAGWFDGVMDLGDGPVQAVGQDVFVAKFNGDGALLWRRTFGNGIAQQARGVEVTPDDGVVVVGGIGGTIDFGGGPVPGGSNDVSVVALDAQGDLRWVRRFDGSGPHAVHGAAVDHEGNVVVTGTYHDELVIGAEVLTSPGGWDDDNIFLVKLSPTGEVRWARRFGDGNPLQAGRDVGTDADGNIILAGSVASTVDFGGGPRIASSADDYDVFVAKFDRDGQHVWSKLFGDALDQQSYAVAVTSSGDIAVGGTTHGGMILGDTTFVADGPFVLKLDPWGDYLWAYGYPGTSGGIYGVDMSADGAVVATGSFSNTLPVGDQALVCAGRSDVLVLSFAP